MMQSQGVIAQLIAIDEVVVPVSYFYDLPRATRIDACIAVVVVFFGSI